MRRKRLPPNRLPGPLIQNRHHRPMPRNPLHRPVRSAKTHANRLKPMQLPIAARQQLPGILGNPVQKIRRRRQILPVSLIRSRRRPVSRPRTQIHETPRPRRPRQLQNVRQPLHIDPDNLLPPLHFQRPLVHRISSGMNHAINAIPPSQPLHRRPIPDIARDKLDPPGPRRHKPPRQIIRRSNIKANHLLPAPRQLPHHVSPHKPRPPRNQNRHTIAPYGQAPYCPAPL